MSKKTATTNEINEPWRIARFRLATPTSDPFQCQCLAQWKWLCRKTLGPLIWTTHPGLCTNDARNTSGWVDSKAHFQTTKFLAFGSQNALGSIVAIGEPERKIYVWQVELWLRQTVVTCFEWAVARKAVGMQWLWAILSRRDQLIQEITCILVMATPNLLHTWYFDPETSNLLFQGHIHGERRSEGDWRRSHRTGDQIPRDGDRVRRNRQSLHDCWVVWRPTILPCKSKDPLQFRTLSEVQGAGWLCQNACHA